MPRQFFHYAATSLATAWLYCTYMVIDGIFISHFLGSAALATLTLALPLVYLPYAFSVMIGVGASTLVSRHLGEGKIEAARAIFTQALWLMAACGLALGFILYNSAPWLMRRMAVDPVLFASTVDYLRIAALFAPFTLFACGLEFFLRLDGAARYGVYCLAGSAILNVGLDYWFIARLGWGLNGAALATGISQIMAMVPMLSYHFYRPRQLKPLRHAFRRGAYSRAIVFNGISEFLIEVAPTVTIVAFNWIILKRQGTAGLEVFAIIEYMTMFAFVTLGALVQSMQPIVAFHRGAGNLAQARQAIWLCSACVVGFSALVGWVMVCFWHPVGRLFAIDEPGTLRMLKTAALWYALALLPAATNILASGYFTACEQPLPAITISISRSWCLLLIILMVLPQWWGNDGVWMTVFCAEILTLPLVLWLSRKPER